MNSNLLSHFSHKENVLFEQTIMLLQFYINELGYKAQLHFELEGCYQTQSSNAVVLDYTKINQQLKCLNIDGELVPEYWQNQWEFVSLFNGQSPLKEAWNLYHAIHKLPVLFAQLYAQQGIINTLIQPVVWFGDKGKLLQGSKDIFSHEYRDVHIPNAIQLNVSVLDKQGKNIISKANFGEYLQRCFLQTSLDNCLLYLPEESAFERLALKTQYGLTEELCSPTDISGGHQGSVALYKEFGKHNQKMGEQALLYDQYNQALSVIHCWEKTARIEHRLGASSVNYNPFLNVIYGLLNVIDALEAYEMDKKHLDKTFTDIPLPMSLYSKAGQLGAVELFQKNTWFSDSINAVQNKIKQLKVTPRGDCPIELGNKIKKVILSKYQQKLIKSE